MTDQEFRDTWRAVAVAATIGMAAVVYGIAVSWATSLRDDYRRAKRSHPAVMSAKSPRVFTVHDTAGHA